MSLAQQFRVVGIDPSLTATGLCVLEFAEPSDYRVTAAETLVTRSRDDLLTRLRVLEIGVENFIGFYALTADPTIVEDVLEQVWVHKNKKPGTIAVMGAAVGVILSTVMHRPNVVLLKPNEWMPKKAGTRGGWHIMPHAEMVRYLMGLVKLPSGVSEHVIMAAGVARYWIEQQRMKARLSA